ncbi:helix-turn-helix domain-containing protein [Cellulomonas denverensis]|uniref:Helix-turn-helix domain-containing protein n=1 Tax=Cellulomonas denverensis TaxID=264297 RepID=A0A7X6QYJ3_9CELL|nr:helix-turn-helix domain-containing protein [Cellulomonas denverensis]NKY22178.1 helix-turn-helix domain-containing protein [Cellulomonas denverensis]GIG27141.1 hypothetical protein Cde04nite_33850 [Cellulomonas denverensis]
MSTATESPLLSPADAAAYLRTSEYRVRRLAQHGEISKIKDGRSVWFTTADLDQYIERQRVKAANPFQTSRPKKRR